MCVELGDELTFGQWALLFGPPFLGTAEVKAHGHAHESETCDPASGLLTHPSLIHPYMPLTHHAMVWYGARRKRIARVTDIVWRAESLLHDVHRWA